MSQSVYNHLQRRAPRAGPGSHHHSAAPPHAARKPPAEGSLVAGAEPWRLGAAQDGTPPRHDHGTRPTHVERLQHEIARAAEAEATLALRLAQQEALNRELIHRMKNNLALLLSLVRVARRKAGAAAEEALLGFEQRLMSVAAVHEVLDANRETELVRADEMIVRLAAGLADALAPEGVLVETALEPLRLHVAEATPLSLVINELVTNALKHAFRGRGGAVRIALRRLADGRCEASVGDDGIGAEEPSGRGGSGTRIVASLGEQLGARIEVVRDGGTMVRLTFAPRPAEHP